MTCARHARARACAGTAAPSGPLGALWTGGAYLVRTLTLTLTLTLTRSRSRSRTLSRWNLLVEPPTFIAQLGDIIDGVNVELGQSERALEARA